MLQDTLNKVTTYRATIQAGLNLLHCFANRINSFITTWKNAMPQSDCSSISGDRIKIEIGSSAVIYLINEGCYIPSDITKLERKDTNSTIASLDQVYTILTHFDEEVDVIFKKLKHDFVSTANEILEALREQAVNDLM